MASETGDLAYTEAMDVSAYTGVDVPHVTPAVVGAGEHRNVTVKTVKLNKPKRK